MILVSDADTGEQLSNVLEVAVHMLRDKLSANVTFLGKGSGTGSDSRWFTVAYEWPNVELDLRAVRQTTEA
jgi:hypothetical protein